jgi:DNA-binding NarL/FixJ family response regulator
LGSHPEFEVVGECATGEDAVEMAKRLKPAVVVIDIGLQGIDSTEAVKQVKKYSPGSKILCISHYTQPSYFRKMMRAGALGFLTRNSSREEMYKAIKEIFEGTKYICNEMKNILCNRFIASDGSNANIASLSVRELEIISYIRKGLSSREIAGNLHIAAKTIEVHRSNILKKLQVKNSASLINFINHEFPE